MKWLLKNENENSNKKYIKENHSKNKKLKNNLRVVNFNNKKVSLIHFVLIFFVLKQILFVQFSEISLIIQGTGQQNIINGDFSSCPDEIYLNSNPLSFTQSNC